VGQRERVVMNNNKHFKIHVTFLAIALIVFIWSVIKPSSYLDWLAEVSPGIVAIIIVVCIYPKFRFTTISYLIIALLSILTFIGGHYTYSEVPLFNWIKEEFHLQRNNYDRFGHFLKGLMAIVIREILIRKTPLTKGAWLTGISISILLAIAAFYEIIEWLSTRISKGSKGAKDFVGMQGDRWDAQWDMFLALLGSIITLLLLTKLHDKYLKRLNK